MERLTINSNNGYEINLDMIDKNIEDCRTKLGKLEDLEEEIGCPIEVIFRALKDGIYSKDFREDITQRAVLMFWEDYGWILQTYSCDEYTKDYKKTWWLKEDKSE